MWWCGPGLWGPLKILQHKASPARPKHECYDTAGWQHSEVITGTHGNKEPEGQAIRENNKSSHCKMQGDKKNYR